MTTAEELINSTYSDDSETEPHIVIGSDRIITVPEKLKKIAVQFDHNIETVTFDCPRFWDGHDMSQMRIYINYINGETKGSYLVQNVNAEDSIMHFDWTITKNATMYSGPILFLVCVRNTDSDGQEINHWNSELNSEMYVSEGLECDEPIAEQYPDLITQLLQRMDVVEQISVTAEEIELAKSEILVASEAAISAKSEIADKIGTINKIIGLPSTIAKVTMPVNTTAWASKIFIDGGIEFIAKKTYTIKLSKSAEVVPYSVYIEMYTSSGASYNQWFIPAGEADTTILFTPIGGAGDLSLGITTGATSGSVSVSITEKEKVIVNFGDSIFGMFRAPIDVSTKLAELIGATVHNCAFSGSRMGWHTYINYDAFSMYRIADAITSGNFTLQDEAMVNDSEPVTLPTNFADALALLKSIDFSKVDIITISFGTNDFTGTLNIDNEDNPYDTSTFAGALRYSLEKILVTFPNCKIFICAPTYRFWIDDNNQFIEDSDTKISIIGKKLTDYVECLRDISTEYHLPFIDNYYDLGINKVNRTLYFPAADGTHHNQEGRNLIAQNMAGKISANGVSYGTSKNSIETFLTEENEEWEV